MARNRIYDKIVYENEVRKDNKSILRDYQLEMKSKGKSKGTIYQYTADIKMFFCWVYKNADNKSVLDLKKRQFRDFFLELRESGVSPARINRVQCSIRNMLSFCNEDDEIYEYEINVMQSIKGLTKEAQRDIHFLTDDQITIILNKLIEKKKYQQALYLSLSYESVGRRAEVFQVLKEPFLNPESKQTNEVRGKRGKKFRLIFLNRTREIANFYLEQRGEDNLPELWVTGIGEDRRPVSYGTLYAWTKSFRKILEKETGEYIEFNPHSFRHSGLENYENGTHIGLKELGTDKLPINVLKTLAHHESIDTTQGYLKNKDEALLAETFGL